MADLVSVVIPARDAEPYLSRAIDSALAQTYSPLEVIVVDDGSRDATYEVASRYCAEVKAIRLPGSLGPAAARNVGVEAANGTYVAFLDADDEWLPEKTARQVAVIECAPDMTFVFCGAAFISETSGTPTLVNQNRIPATGREAWKTLLAYPFVCTPAVLARRDVVLRAGLFDSTLTIAEDQDLWIRLARIGPIGHVPEVLARVHDMPGSLTKRRKPHEGVTRTLEMIARHVTAASSELSPTEIREIYAERLFCLGRNAYETGATMLGIRLLLRSTDFGRPVVPMLRYLLAASSFGRLVKRSMGARRTVDPGRVESAATQYSKWNQ